MILLGIVLMVAGIILAIYMGVWVMLIGGIVAIVEAVKATPVSAHGIAWGICRVVFAGVVGGLSFWLMFLPSLACIKKGLKKRNTKPPA